MNANPLLNPLEEKAIIKIQELLKDNVTNPNLYLNRIKDCLKPNDFRNSNTLREKEGKFLDEMTDLINKYSMENGSNTPDSILANYMLESLFVFERAVKSRDQYYDIPKESNQTK